MIDDDDDDFFNSYRTYTIKKEEDKDKDKAIKETEVDKFKKFEMTVEVYKKHVVKEANQVVFKRYMAEVNNGKAPRLADAIECFDLLGFWKEMHDDGHYPVLSKIAASHLGGPSAESYCESVFSWCKKIRTAERASMGDELFGDMAITHMSMDKLDV